MSNLRARLQMLNTINAINLMPTNSTTSETKSYIRDSFPKTNASLACPGFGATSPPQGVRSMSPGPDFRGADRERCVSYFTLLWWSKNTLSAMTGRRKRPVRCSGKLRWSSFAAATSRERDRPPTSGPSGPTGQPPRWGRGPVPVLQLWQ